MRVGFPLCLGVLILFSCESNQISNEYDPESFIDPELFKDHIRVTDFQTPEEEMAGFHLPPDLKLIFLLLNLTLPNPSIWSLMIKVGFG
ncbi:hypothetical protein V8V91_13590 [Algoriphagus halophilus]|uniref:hypothetical protein n=1 Tax=Algoriphagus halophilus TaxID=226505 RepID=UPI00358FA26F